MEEVPMLFRMPVWERLSSKAYSRMQDLISDGSVKRLAGWRPEDAIIGNY
jgi:hypothetical protein